MLPTQKLATRPQKISGCCVDELRAGHDALDDQRAEQQRHDGVAGNAEAHGRDEIALHRGVGRGLRAGDALDHAGAEASPASSRSSSRWHRRRTRRWSARCRE